MGFGCKLARCKFAPKTQAPIDRAKAERRLHFQKRNQMPFRKASTNLLVEGRLRDVKPKHHKKIEKLAPWHHGTPVPSVPTFCDVKPKHHSMRGVQPLAQKTPLNEGGPNNRRKTQALPSLPSLPSLSAVCFEELLGDVKPKHTRITMIVPRAGQSAQGASSRSWET